MAKAAIMITFKLDTQKDTCPNTFASRKFTPNRITAKITIQSQVGVPGRISSMIMAEATICAVMVIAPPDQLTQPMVKPIAGLINSVEYACKDPATGIAADSSPRQLVIR